MGVYKCVGCGRTNKVADDRAKQFQCYKCKYIQPVPRRLRWLRPVLIMAAALLAACGAAYGLGLFDNPYRWEEETANSLPQISPSATDTPGKAEAFAIALSMVKERQRPGDVAFSNDIAPQSIIHDGEQIFILIYPFTDGADKKQHTCYCKLKWMGGNWANKRNWFTMALSIDTPYKNVTAAPHPIPCRVKYDVTAETTSETKIAMRDRTDTESVKVAVKNACHNRCGYLERMMIWKSRDAYERQTPGTQLAQYTSVYDTANCRATYELRFMSGIIVHGSPEDY